MDFLSLFILESAAQLTSMTLSCSYNGLHPTASAVYAYTLGNAWIYTLCKINVGSAYSIVCNFSV